MDRGRRDCTDCLIRTGIWWAVVGSGDTEEISNTWKDRPGSDVDDLG